MASSSAINDAAFTRAATPITLMLWPAMMAARGAIVRPWNTRIALIILALAIPTTFLSPQETSKLALVVGLIAFALTWLTRRWAAAPDRGGVDRVVSRCRAGGAAGAPARLHNAPWLQTSAQHRIIIWNYTAEHVMKSPLLGIGAYMTYLTGLKRSADAVPEPDEKQSGKVAVAPFA